MTTAVAVLALLQPMAASAVTDVDGSTIGLHAPKTAKPGKTFWLSADIAFDSAEDSPPTTYLSAGVWQHRGDAPCRKAVPMDELGQDLAGWVELYQTTWFPEDDADEAYTWDQPLRRKVGTYRWCGYVYTTDEVFSGGAYHATFHVLDRAQARTQVAR